MYSSGIDISEYMASFADRHLRGKIRFGIEVLNLRRVSNGDKRSWMVKIRPLKTGKEEELKFAKVVLCTGVCLELRVGSVLWLTHIVGL